MNTTDEFAAIIAAAEMAEMDDLTPRVLLTETVDGTPIYVVECVMPQEDGPANRSYLWHAITGAFTLTPGCWAQVCDDYRQAAPSAQAGGTFLASSTISAHAAMDNAKRNLRRR